MANTLYLVRGLPGAGKSTLAKRLGCAHVEADMFHIHGGVYLFDGARVKDAHEWCQKTTELLLKIGDVVVSNTFTRHWEMEPYYAFGAAHVVELTVKTIFTDAELAERTVHAVPVETIKAMRERWEN